MLHGSRQHQGVMSTKGLAFEEVPTPPVAPVADLDHEGVGGWIDMDELPVDSDRRKIGSGTAGEPPFVSIVERTAGIECIRVCSGALILIITQLILLMIRRSSTRGTL